MIFVDFAVNKDCLNLIDSYGEICVHCNACGRFNKDTMFQDRLEVYKRQLQEQYEFDNWIEGFEELQKTNIKKNIDSYQQLIRETEEALAKTRGESHE